MAKNFPKKLLILAATVAIVLLALGGCSPQFEKRDISATLKSEGVTLTEGAELRIMSANVLVHMESWGGTPVPPRAHMFAQVLGAYAPDVVGLQEFDSHWYKYLTESISDTYEFVQPKQNFFQENRSPLIYNKQTLELVSYDYHIYSKKDTSRCRVVTSGVFKHKATGKLFAVTSTHWDLGMSETKVEYRTTQLYELAEIVDRIRRENPDIPVFCCGDYNSMERTEEEASASYREFMEVSGAIDVKFIEGIRQYTGSTGVWVAESWDHIFLKGNSDVKAFGIIAEPFSLDMSDHYPIFVDTALI